MAAATVSVALAVLFFFTISQSVARIQISKPKYDVTVHQFSNPLPEADVKAFIRLPSESNVEIKHPADVQVAQAETSDQESKPIEHLADSSGQEALPVEHQPESIAVENKQRIEHQSELPIEDRAETNNDGSKLIERQTELGAKEGQPEYNEEQSKPIEQQPELNAKEAQPVEPETKVGATVEAVPLKQVRFRPINHQFRLRSRLPYRLCRHNHFHHGQENMPSRSQVQIPYGNGMMLTFVENSDFDEEVFHGSVSHVPPKRFPFLHHHGPYHLRQHDVNEEKVSNRLSGNDHASINHVQPKWIPFLHHHGPHHLHQHDDKEEKVSNRLPENDHEKPKKFHHHNGDEEEKRKEKRHGNGKKNATLRRRIGKFLGHYFD